LDHLLAKIDTFGTIKRRPGTGLTNRTVHTNDNIDEVADLVQSQEDCPQTHCSIRQIAHEISISRLSVHCIIKTDLKLKCLKKERAQELTESDRFNRLQRSRELLKRYPMHLVDFIWFSDETLFTIAALSSPQNNRVYVQSSVKKRNVSAFSKSVMVSLEVSVMGYTQLHFLEPGVKVNGDYYRNVVLKEMLLPDIRHITGDCFIFQQDSMPAHCARDTVALLRKETLTLSHLICGHRIHPT